MTRQRVLWTVKDRYIEPRGDEVSALCLVLTYPDRECELRISLQHPLAGGTPENEAAVNEMHLLRDALNDILGER